MNDGRIERDVGFLFELGSLRHVERTWRQFGGVPYANVAEHTLRVCWIAMMIAVHEKANTDRVIKLAMVHDIPEIRTGDVNYLSRMYVDRHEGKALSDMTDGTSIQEEIASLWHECQERATLEAKIVKDADTLDCDLELMESSSVGHSIMGALRPTRDRAYERMYTKTGRRIFETIYESDPHAWHVNGRNRMTAGDWRPVQVVPESDGQQRQ